MRRYSATDEIWSSISISKERLKGVLSLVSLYLPDRYSLHITRQETYPARHLAATAALLSRLKQAWAVDRGGIIFRYFWDKYLDTKRSPLGGPLLRSWCDGFSIRHGSAIRNYGVRLYVDKIPNRDPLADLNTISDVAINAGRSVGPDVSEIGHPFFTEMLDIHRGR